MDGVAVAARKARFNIRSLLRIATRFAVSSRQASNRELFAWNIGHHLDSIRGQTAILADAVQPDQMETSTQVVSPRSSITVRRILGYFGCCAPFFSEAAHFSPRNRVLENPSHHTTVWAIVGRTRVEGIGAQTA